MYTVVAENDVSEWADETGKRYHFPKRYEKLLQPGTVVIYYKGSMKRADFAHKRLSPFAHYFGVAKVKRIEPDHDSTKGDLFAELADFRAFNEAVLNKDGDKYLEVIPPNRQSNFWRDGVRAASEATYKSIASRAGWSHAEIEGFIQSQLA